MNYEMQKMNENSYSIIKWNAGRTFFKVLKAGIRKELAMAMLASYAGSALDYEIMNRKGEKA
jgi:hypothetical protein